MRELGEAIVTDGDPARVVEQARELVDVLRGLDEWDHGPGRMRPIPMVALNDYQVALIYSLVVGPDLEIRSRGESRRRRAVATFATRCATARTARVRKAVEKLPDG